MNAIVANSAIITIAIVTVFQLLFLELVSPLAHTHIEELQV